MPNIDDDLNSIERDIRTLKIEYEQYFGGGRSRPPTDTQWRLEVMLKRYSDRAAEFTSGQRFRYSNLSQTYAKYQDMWRKKLAQRETGTTQHHYGAAAKAIQQERDDESGGRAGANRSGARGGRVTRRRGRGDAGCRTKACVKYVCDGIFGSGARDRKSGDALSSSGTGAHRYGGKIGSAEPERFREIRAEENQGPER